MRNRPLSLILVLVLLAGCHKPYWGMPLSSPGVRKQQGGAMETLAIGVLGLFDLLLLPVTGPHDIWVMSQHGSLESIRVAYHGGEIQDAQTRLQRYLENYPDDGDADALRERMQKDGKWETAR